MVSLLPLPKQPGKGNTFLEFLPDSPEQITESMNGMWVLRDKLHSALQAAIARANRSQHFVIPENADLVKF